MITIALATLREALRKKLLLFVLIGTALYLALLTIVMLVAHASLAENGLIPAEAGRQLAALVSVLGYQMSGVLIAFVAVVVSAGAVAAEIGNGVVHTILTRPLSRAGYLFGKYLGQAALVGAFATAIYLHIAIVSTIKGIPPAGDAGIGALLGGLGLFVLEPLILLAACLLIGTRLKMMAGGVACGFLYLLGHLGLLLQQIGAWQQGWIEEAGYLITLISPFHSLYSAMLGTLFAGSGTTLIEIPLFFHGTATQTGMIVYASAYGLVLLGLAGWSFAKKDL